MKTLPCAGALVDVLLSKIKIYTEIVVFRNYIIFQVKI
jgi:hypothetical protein